MHGGAEAFKAPSSPHHAMLPCEDRHTPPGLQQNPAIWYYLIWRFLKVFQRHREACLSRGALFSVVDQAGLANERPGRHHAATPLRFLYVAQHEL